MKLLPTQAVAHLAYHNRRRVSTTDAYAGEKIQRWKNWKKSQREEGESNVLGRRPTLVQSNQNPQNISKVDEEGHPTKITQEMKKRFIKN
jgi:hypothetical protein